MLVYDSKKIIDCHIHAVENDPLFEENLLKYTDTLGAGIILASTFAAHLGKREFSNTALIRLLEKRENLFGILSYPLSYFNPPDAKEVSHKKILGVKFYTGYFPYNEKIILQYIESLKHMGISHFMFHGGFCNIKTEQVIFDPKILEPIIRAYPNDQFIIAHIGTPHTQTVYDLMHRYRNLSTDISGLFSGKNTMAYMNKDEILSIREFIRTARTSPEIWKRIFFGTDYPIIDTTTYIQYARLLGISLEDILHFSSNTTHSLNLPFSYV